MKCINKDRVLLSEKQVERAREREREKERERELCRGRELGLRDILIFA